MPLKTIQLQDVNLIRKGCFPLKENERVDLYAACHGLKKELKHTVQYDNESNFHRLSVHFNGVKFVVFSSGKIFIFGAVSKKKQEKALAEFYNLRLKKFVKKKKVKINGIV